MKKEINTNWTPELAYIVGLITTDGCLSPDGRHISFTSKDIDLIKTFASILELENKIGITRNKVSETFRFQFGNVTFYKWLKERGLTPKKSRTLNEIEVPNEFFIDFLRGHLDGDGSITTYTDHFNSTKNPKYIYERLCVRFISASQKHLKWLEEKISTLLKIEGSFHNTKANAKTGNSMHVLKFGKKSSIQLLNLMYYSDNLPCLERKRKLAEPFLTKKATSCEVAIVLTVRHMFDETIRSF